ncbi:unnamed protein product, partial [Rotaria sordida]
MLQLGNGREFVAKVIEELTEMWKGLKIVHGKPCHPQSQGFVERSNQDTKQLRNAPNSLNLIDDECQQEGQGDAIDYNKQNDNNNNDNNINNNDNEQNDNEQDIQDLNTFINNTSSSLNKRIKITDAIRQNAREGQKHEAD